MAPSRAYVPSPALLRALSRPQPPPCPFARRPTTPFIRGKRTRAAKLAKLDPVDPKQAEQMFQDTAKRLESADFDNMRPLSDRELESDDLPVISWYEQDLDKGTPRRLTSRLATAEDRKKDKEMYLMIEESVKNPDYDDAALNRRLIDSLISNPNFADLTQDLMDIKKDIRSKEEIKAIEEEQNKHIEEHMGRKTKQFNASLRMATHQALRDLIDDPDAAAAKEDLQEVLDRMPEVEEIDTPEFQAVLEKAMTKLNDSPAFQKKMAATAEEDTDAEFEKEWAHFENQAEEVFNEEETDADLAPETIEDIHDVDKLLTQMRDVMKSIGGDSQLEAELDAALNEDPNAEQEGVFEREMYPEELAEELKKLIDSKVLTPKEEEPEENIPADLQAKVDRIMEDPKLMQKLVYIQSLIEEATPKADITSITHEVAPDPLSLDPTRTTTLGQRIEIARSDPTHTAALSRLRVRLLPPFNISPALKSFNQAIELAYIGANDDTRRILWRSYQKARTLPTFLQNVSDDAWDILYYSQAVTWGSNQNRQDHLRLLLKDLKSLGREGPPTHPESLVKRGDGEHLEV